MINIDMCEAAFCQTILCQLGSHWCQNRQAAQSLTSDLVSFTRRIRVVLSNGLQFFLGFVSRFFLGFFSCFLGFDGFDWYLQRFAAKLSDLHGVVVVVVVVVGWMDGWLVG